MMLPQRQRKKNKGGKGKIVKISNMSPQKVHAGLEVAYTQIAALHKRLAGICEEDNLDDEESTMYISSM